MSGIIGLPNNVGTGKIGPPSGTLLQTVITTVTGSQSTSSTSFTHFGDYDTNITPHFTNSRIQLTFSSDGYNGTNNGHNYHTLYRDSTNLGHSTHGIRLRSSAGGGEGHWSNIHFIYNDTAHNTTSQITYKFYFRVGSGTGFVVYQAGTPTFLMAQEFAP